MCRWCHRRSCYRGAFNASYGGLFLLDLDTLQAQPLMIGSDKETIDRAMISALYRITGNGCDRLCVGQGLDGQYLRLIVE